MKNSEKPIFKRLVKSIDSFFNDDTTYFAASLSFFTIFSILPIITLGIAIISQFPEFQTSIDIITNFLLTFLNPTHSEVILDNLKRFISNSDKLGSIGILYMIFVYIMFFKDYDYIVNKIHQTRRRAIYKSFFIYTIFFVIFPAVFITLNFLLSSYNNFFKQFFFFLFIWFIFFTLFKVSVNKKISTKAAAISSFITLSTLFITKNLFIYYVIYNKTYATIYGSLATLLFSILWIYVSWIIYLFGVKMCHRLNIKYSHHII